MAPDGEYCTNCPHWMPLSVCCWLELTKSETNRASAIRIHGPCPIEHATTYEQAMEIMLLKELTNETKP